MIGLFCLSDVCIVNVIGILTDSPNTRKYWSVLRTSLREVAELLR